MPAWLNRNVWGMTLTSLFSDACYEMVLAVLPGFLPVIHVAAAALGWIEGASDAFSSFLKLFAGWYSDRIGQRKRMIVVGYLFTGTGLSIFSTRGIVDSHPAGPHGELVRQRNSGIVARCDALGIGGPERAWTRLWIPSRGRYGGRDRRAAGGNRAIVFPPENYAGRTVSNYISAVTDSRSLRAAGVCMDGTGNQATAEAGH